MRDVLEAARQLLLFVSVRKPRIRGFGRSDTRELTPSCVILEAHELTVDHKLSDPEERRRITEVGGVVRRQDRSSIEDDASNLRVEALSVWRQETLSLARISKILSRKCLVLLYVRFIELKLTTMSSS